MKQYALILLFGFMIAGCGSDASTQTHVPTQVEEPMELDSEETLESEAPPPPPPP